MAKSHRKSTPQREEDRWASLTWGDLDSWAGGRSTSRGRTYQKRGAVEGLVFTRDLQLLATVQGGDSYTTLVWLKSSGPARDALRSTCTCPVGSSGCKHAVAVVAEYLDMLARGQEVQVCEEEDDRMMDIGPPDFSDDDADEEDELPQPKRPSDDDKVRQHIEGKSREELVELVLELTRTYPEFRNQLTDTIALTHCNAADLFKRTRHALTQALSQPGWRSWSDGHTPDFSKFRGSFNRLMELGELDRCAELAGKLIEDGLSMVGESHDEGETAAEVRSCLPMAFDAVMRCSWPAWKKILFAIDACLADDYSVIDDEADVILEGITEPSDWAKVAEQLRDRLGDAGKTSEVFSQYRRDAISSWLADAMERSGQKDAVLELYRKEARINGSYERLVKYLVENKQTDEAGKWAAEGIEKLFSKQPGTANGLATQLCAIAEQRKQWEAVAAHAAYHFFDHPSVKSLATLCEAARKAKCEQVIRTIAIAFLETGARPLTVEGGEKGPWTAKPAKEWPLPVPNYLLPLIGSSRAAARRGPNYGVLIDLAIAENRFDDVLRWYDALKGGNRNRGDDWFGYNYDDTVAEAVAKTHPLQSLEIYARRVDAALVPTGASAYESAASYLRKMRPLFAALGRELEFGKVVAKIRERYRNRPKLMEILDKLENRPIVQSPRRRW